MKKFIHASKEQKEKLMKIFHCGDRTVRNALTFDEGKGDSDLCKKIRFTALQDGCHTYVVVKEFECFHDEADGIMYQLFPNGAQVELDKNTGIGEVYYKGELIARYERVQLTDINAIQARARAAGKKAIAV